MVIFEKSNNIRRQKGTHDRAYPCPNPIWVKIPFKTFKSSPLRQHCILIWPDGAQGKSVWDYRWTPVIQGLTLRFLKRDFHNIWLQAGFEKILIYCDSNGGNYSLPGTIACSSPAPTPFLSLSWGFAIQGWPGEWWCGRWCLVDESQIRNKGWSWSQSWGQSWYRLRSWSWAGPSGIKNFNPGIFRDGIS